MPLGIWTTDYVSGINEVDEHHKTLFGMVNDFAENNDENVSIKVIKSFLRDLAAYCQVHFKVEEDMMARVEFPLIDHHIEIHENLKKTVVKVNQQLDKNSLRDPYASIISFTANWLNEHIARDDLTFFSYYKNINYSLDKRLMDRRCVISTLNNEILGHGRITSIHRTDVEISNTSTQKIPVNLGDMVKVSAISKEIAQTFIAKVFYSTPNLLRLFNCTIVQVINNRKHFRVATKIPASVLFGNQTFICSIVDISVGGIMIETGQSLELGDLVKVYFVIQNNEMNQLCQVKRVTKSADSPNLSYYGLEFSTIESADADKINSFVFNRQTLERRGR